ncbi:MAG: BLUF domain-containing protein [Casimicrobiaceae bacterium]|nr:BLUF domain-containing protein [Casimicrobiaceae bacterium]MCX8099114.1 BLUF domain-containing protein [Casimicrobiaceae bacterium]MDW8312181.1 BLUF domain-containing protein [Burkholderiales bacterium]
MLVRLVYASQAHVAVTPEVFDDILNVSRRKNAQTGITGVLCTNGHVFLQLLEGSRAAVNQLYGRILRDPRHRDVQLLHFEEIHERKFASWSMGRVTLDRINTAIVLKYSPSAELDPFSVSGTASVALLEELMQSAHVS